MMSCPKRGVTAEREEAGAAGGLGAMGTCTLVWGDGPGLLASGTLLDIAGMGGEGGQVRPRWRLFV